MQNHYSKKVKIYRSLNLILFFGLNLSFLCAQTSLVFGLKVEENVMHVDLTYYPLVQNKTVFKYGDEYYGGMKDLMKGLRHLKSSVSFEVDTAASTITFYHSDQTVVNISYDIVDTHTPQQRVVGEMFRPILSDKYFFSLSHSLFLTPVINSAVLDTARVTVHLDEVQAFPMFLSFAPELKPGHSTIASHHKIMDALITGAADLHVEEKTMGGIKNYIVLRINEGNQNNLVRFMDYFNCFIPAIVDFWGPMEGYFYSMIASPFLDIKYHDVSGTAFEDGFHIKYSGDTILANNEIIRVVSHEMMHRFIGAGLVSLGEKHQWFDEGFTDFTTWYVLSKSGILPTEELQSTLHKTYEKWSANPVKNIINDSIATHFWDDHNYEKLPYQRGALFAAYMAKLISEVSHGSNNFADFMQGLRTKADQNKNALSLEDFVNIAANFIPKNEVQFALNNYIIEGNPIPKEKIF